MSCDNVNVGNGQLVNFGGNTLDATGATDADEDGATDADEAGATDADEAGATDADEADATDADEAGAADEGDDEDAAATKEGGNPAVRPIVVLNFSKSSILDVGFATPNNDTPLFTPEAGDALSASAADFNSLYSLTISSSISASVFGA